jgi:uncharacterized small protein (DUF1192 family)
MSAEIARLRSELQHERDERAALEALAAAGAVDENGELC